MKRTFCYLLMFLLLVALLGCASNDVLNNEHYKIVEKNGEYVMIFHESIPTIKGDASLSAESISFASLAEMKETIEDGGFTEAQLTDIQKNFANSGGAIAICNIDVLFEAVLPQTATVTSVEWFGSSYSFLFEDDGIAGTLNPTDKATCDFKEELYGNRSAENTAISIVSEDTDPSRNASIVVFDTVLTGERWKEIRYNYSSDNTNMVILERYQYIHSDTVPKSVIIWGQSNGMYFTASMWTFTERPSYEWVTSFGLKPYVETETE